MSAGATDPRIQAALERADELAGPDPEQHVEVYEEVHDTLQQVLSDAGDPSPVAATSEKPESRASEQRDGGQVEPAAADAAT